MQPLAGNVGIDVGIEPETRGRNAGANAAVVNQQDFTSEIHARSYWKGGSDGKAAEFQLLPITGEAGRLQINAVY